jgi:hypothetical protein
MGVVMLAGAAWKWRTRGDDEGPAAQPDDGPPVFTNPFALLPALKWAVLLCAVLLLAVAAEHLLGEEGILLAAAASGLADVDAINIAASRQAADGLLSVELRSRYRPIRWSRAGWPGSAAAAASAPTSPRYSPPPWRSARCWRCGRCSSEPGALSCEGDL